MRLVLMRRIFAAIVLISCLGAVSSVTAVEDEKTIQKLIPQEILEYGKGNFLTLTVENDSLGGGADKNYTSGVRLTYFNVKEKPGKLAEWFDGIIPIFSINETTTTAYSLGQNLYTPDDITQVNQVPGARPWAAFLYGSLGLSTVTDNHVDDVEVTLGVVGPWAQGEEVQKYVHDVLNVNEPMGWDHQLDNELGFILSWRRRWPRFFDREMYSLIFSVEPNVGGSLGNIYTLAETGFTMRLAPSSGRWQDTPLLVRPSMPGSGFFQSQKQKIGWYLFGGLQGRAVARNIFLDGNTFEDSYSVDKKPFVMDVNAGIAFTFRDVRLSYALVYRTKEFNGQDDGSLFGTVSTGYRF